LLQKVKSLLKNKKIELITYGIPSADYHFEIIEWDFEGARVKLKAKEEVCEVDLPIFVPFQIENLLGAISIAHQFFPLKKIKSVLPKITVLEKSMSFQRKDGLLIFDASYNANPRGVLEAINFFQKLPVANKFIIFHGLIELGNLAEKVFREIGKKANFVNNFISTFSDYDKILKDELKEKFVLVKKRKELELFIKAIPPNSSAILILGRPTKEFSNIVT